MPLPSLRGAAFAWCATLRATYVSCAFTPLALKSASLRALFAANSWPRIFSFIPLSDWPPQCRECLSFDARCRCVDLKAVVPSEIKRLLRRGWWQGDCCANWCGGKPPWAAELTMVSRTGDQPKHSEKGESHEISKLLSLTTFGCGSRRWYSNCRGRSR